MAFGLPAQADASVGNMSASLTITSSCVGGGSACGVEAVKVTGFVSMTQSEAQSLLNQRYNVVIRLWGDDAFSDDLLLGPYSPAEVYADSSGLRFKALNYVGSSLLNEDPGWGVVDEIYAGVRLLRPDTSTLRSAETNRINALW